MVEEPVSVIITSETAIGQKKRCKKKDSNELFHRMSRYKSGVFDQYSSTQKTNASLIKINYEGQLYISNHQKRCAWMCFCFIRAMDREAIIMSAHQGN